LDGGETQELSWVKCSSYLTQSAISLQPIQSPYKQILSTNKILC